MAYDLAYFRPDIDCNDASSTTNNPWKTCYYSGPCVDNQFGAYFTINFGSSIATYKLPVDALQIDYVVSGNNFCAVGVQDISKMDRVFDLTTESHIYFGDIFFKQFVGVFDLGTTTNAATLGFALSNHAYSGTELVCAGTSCD